MEIRQIANIINTEMIPNMLGVETTVAEDLSNVVEVFTPLQSINDTDFFKSVHQRFAIGVTKVEFDTRAYKNSSLGLITDSDEYASIIQRVKGKLLQTYDSDKNDLVNGNNYFDGTYYGFEESVELVSDSDQFEVRYSIPNTQFKSYFTSKENLVRYISLIQSKVNDTINNAVHLLEKATLVKLISESRDRTLHLITLYNAETGSTLSTSEPTVAESDRDFQVWCASLIERIKVALTEYSATYNDGSIETFTPMADIKVTLLNEFATKNRYANNQTFNKEIGLFNNYNVVNAWQNRGNVLLPSIATTGEIKETGKATLSNIVGVIYDKYACGVTLIEPNNVTSQYIARGDYNTYFHTVQNRYFVDPLNNAVVLALD